MSRIIADRLLDVQMQNAATLESKLKADRRNAALQQQLGALKQDLQLSERALLSSQVRLSSVSNI